MLGMATLGTTLGRCIVDRFGGAKGLNMNDRAVDVQGDRPRDHAGTAESAAIPAQASAIDAEDSRPSAPHAESRVIGRARVVFPKPTPTAPADLDAQQATSDHPETQATSDRPETQTASDRPETSGILADNRGDPRLAAALSIADQLR